MSNDDHKESFRRREKEFLISLLLLRTGVTLFDVMRYASVQYSTLYQRFLDSAKQDYPEYDYSLKED